MLIFHQGLEILFFFSFFIEIDDEIEIWNLKSIILTYITIQFRLIINYRSESERKKLEFFRFSSSFAVPCIFYKYKFQSCVSLTYSSLSGLGEVLFLNFGKNFCLSESLCDAKKGFKQRDACSDLILDADWLKRVRALKSFANLFHNTHSPIVSFIVQVEQTTYTCYWKKNKDSCLIVYCNNINIKIVFVSYI
ncbi:hypothetical protein BpHYR1_008414 [Brachionus plicatilis]|uniref:Uncharacterized protein n=1 Tax=Brachionus plicatilis TaxID=10195 RepID=A0A3M7SB83_BRAPC|nr:hypothetical protein BpHYR1_008414 [Brachionus plicatilis]